MTHDEALEKIGEIVYGRHERGFVMWPLTGDERLMISDVLDDFSDCVAGNAYLDARYYND